MAGEVTEALEEAHSRRIIHGDLKPADIMFTAGGRIKVMDFGLVVEHLRRSASSG
ncbi:MAG: protein kinase, partial [Acidobacteriota bacterium]